MAEISTSFIDLPDTALVNVMTLLSLQDRSRLSRTCSRLRDVFEHPSVWFKVNICMLGDHTETSPQNRPVPLILPDRFAVMIEKYGSYFQDLSLTVVGLVTKVESAVERVLVLLAETCRLSSLSLRVGELLSTNTTRAALNNESLEILATLLRKSFRLRSLYLITWPVHPRNKNFDILECLRENEKIKPLERLSLFWRSGRSNTWMPLNASLPEGESVFETVRYFNSLRELRLCSTMLTESLLKELAMRPILRKLCVLVMYSRNTESEGFFVLTDSAWATLSRAVSVELTFSNTVPHYVLVSVLTPHIPLTSISFMKHSDYDEPLFSYLSSHFHSTLSEFNDFSRSRENYDNEMIEMVRRCNKLNRLVYLSAVRSSSILILAELRGRSWMDFEFDVKAVVLEDDETVAKRYRHGDDDVIGVTDEGKNYIVSHLPVMSSRFYHTDESEAYRTVSLDDLISRVTQIIGRKWVKSTDDALQMIYW